MQSKESKARHERELLEFLAAISTEHEAKLRHVLEEEAKVSEAQARWEAFAESVSVQEEWDAAKHPRGGFLRNLGWFSPVGGLSVAAKASLERLPAKVTTTPTPPARVARPKRTAANGQGMSALYKGIIKKNQDLARELGVMPERSIHSSRLAMELDSAKQSSSRCR